MSKGDWSQHAETGEGDHYVPIKDEHLDHGHCPCGVYVRWDLTHGRWVPSAAAAAKARVAAKIAEADAKYQAKQEGGS